MYLLDIRHFIFIIQVRFVFMLCDDHEITETRIFCNINIYYNINFLTFLKFDVSLLDFSSYQGANVKAEEGIVALSETVIIIC